MPRRMTCIHLPEAWHRLEAWLAPTEAVVRFDERTGSFRRV
jgi:hypothetical protein